MKFFIFLLLIFSISANASPGNSLVDPINLTAQKLFKIKVKSIYKKALACNPMEIDLSTGKTASEWMGMFPVVPSWRMLDKFLKVAHEAHDYAEVKTGSDKVQHCFAGCFIRKKLDLKSAIMIAWLKELNDSSDCSVNTHFEESDFFATYAGAIAGQNTDCKKFCHRDDLKNATGEEMYDEAIKNGATSNVAP